MMNGIPVNKEATPAKHFIGWVGKQRQYKGTVWARNVKIHRWGNRVLSAGNRPDVRRGLFLWVVAPNPKAGVPDRNVGTVLVEPAGTLDVPPHLRGERFAGNDPQEQIDEGERRRVNRGDGVDLEIHLDGIDRYSQGVHPEGLGEVPRFHNPVYHFFSFSTK